MMSYLTLPLSNTSTLCWLMCLFLSNFGSLMSRIVATSWVLRWPARVLTSLVSPSSFVIIFQWGWSFDHRDIRAWVKEYSKKSSTSYGTNCISGTDDHRWFLFRDLDLWPMVVESRYVILDLLAFTVKSCGCVPSRGIGVVKDWCVWCGESWVYL